MPPVARRRSGCSSHEQRRAEGTTARKENNAGQYEIDKSEGGILYHKTPKLIADNFIGRRLKSIKAVSSTEGASYFRINLDTKDRWTKGRSTNVGVNKLNENQKSVYVLCRGGTHSKVGSSGTGSVHLGDRGSGFPVHVRTWESCGGCTSTRFMRTVRTAKHA